MRFFFLFLLLLSVAGPAWADEPAFTRVVKSNTIRCGYFSWPPYITKDPNTGQLSGINYDVMEAVGKNLHLKIEWVAEIGVGEVVTALNAGKFDVMCASIWPDPARVRNLSLTDATFYSAVHAFTRAGDARFDGDLAKANHKDIKVAVIDGDVGQYLAAEKLPAAQIVALPQMVSGGELLMEVASKKADLVLVDRALVNDFLKTNPGTLREVKNIQAVRVFGEHLAVAPGEGRLRDMINIALGQLANDGAIADMTARYAREYKAEFYPPKSSVDMVPARP
jgi:ABC-type amino acid transport substrate-binding protein